MMIIKILTKLKGRFVGQDSYGNRYYEEKFLFSRPPRKPRRWVLYKDMVEASKVPAEWFGWLHYTFEAPLSEENKQPWQKPHQMNLTGTAQAYRPEGHVTRKGTIQKAPKAYESWHPN